MEPVEMAVTAPLPRPALIRAVGTALTCPDRGTEYVWIHEAVI